MKKIIECLDETMERRKLQEKINPILVRLITAMHDKKSYQKGWKMFVAPIYNNTESDSNNKLLEHPLLK